MAFVNYNNREITAKIVYYGPALSGKTTCLRYIYTSQEIDNKGKLITLDTDGDRTLFFDFLPMEIGKLGNYSIKIQMYTVPGQVSYDTTRKLVLQGADGVIFVADSQVVARELNIESLSNLKKNLKLNNISFQESPLIFQYNKRDLKEILPIDILNKDLNPDNRSFFPTIATNGENVLEGLHAVIRMVIIQLKNKLSIFQKDKTVMFSREEITSATPVPKKNEPDNLEEQTDEEVLNNPVVASPVEDVFELSSPMSDQEIQHANAFSDDDIFQLDQKEVVSSDERPTSIPVFDKAMGVDAYRTQIPSKHIQPEDDAQTPQPMQRKSGERPAVIMPPKTIEIPPIHLEIPEFNDTLHVTLHLEIRKK